MTSGEYEKLAFDKNHDVVFILEEKLADMSSDRYSKMVTESAIFQAVMGGILGWALSLGAMVASRIFLTPEQLAPIMPYQDIAVWVFALLFASVFGVVSHARYKRRYEETMYERKETPVKLKYTTPDTTSHIVSVRGNDTLQSINSHNKELQTPTGQIVTVSGAVVDALRRRVTVEGVEWFNQGVFLEMPAFFPELNETHQKQQYGTLLSALEHNGLAMRKGNRQAWTQAGKNWLGVDEY